MEIIELVITEQLSKSEIQRFKKETGITDDKFEVVIIRQDWDMGSFVCRLPNNQEVEFMEDWWHPIITNKENE